VKGVSRNPDSAASQALQAKGVEMLQGDSDDPESLKKAVQGAQVVFGNTAFSSKAAVATDEDLAKLKPGQEMRELCCELEVQQGKNIADAVAMVEGLELFYLVLAF